VHGRRLLPSAWREWRLSVVISWALLGLAFFCVLRVGFFFYVYVRSLDQMRDRTGQNTNTKRIGSFEAKGNSFKLQAKHKEQSKASS
jgi:hypothetical protein